MSMDIRFPIGFMFTLTGLIITLWGLVSNPDIYRKSLGININLWTGLGMLIFGLLFLSMSIARARKKHRGELQ